MTAERTEYEGTIVRGNELEPVEGRLVVDPEDGTIAAIEEEFVESDAIVLPAFVNAHTHVGDSIAKEAGGPQYSLAELVAPPDGLKHRLLRAADREDVIEGMRRSVRLMERSGTGVFADFREGGVDGVKMVREATARSDVEGLAFGRDSIDALDAGDGFGASGANDATFEREREAAREREKPFAIHAGEADPSDLTPALDLDPAFLVHVVHPEAHHLDRIEEAETPVVVCPRSNVVTGVGLPPVEELTERTTVGLGTDNVMFNEPSMFREMAFLAKLTDLSARAVLRTATVNGAAALGRSDGVLDVGRPARFQVLDGTSDTLVGVQDPIRGVVRRAGMADVREVVLHDSADESHPPR